VVHVVSTVMSLTLGFRQSTELFYTLKLAPVYAKWGNSTIYENGLDKKEWADINFYCTGLCGNIEKKKRRV